MAEKRSPRKSTTRATPKNTPRASLTPLEQLQLLIGRVAQADVSLEFGLRNLFVFLCVPSPAIHLTPASFNPLHEACVTMLDNVDMSSEWREAVDDTMREAKRAHGERNRVVHDMWFAEQGDPTRWVGQRFSRGLTPPRPAKRTLDDLLHVWESVVRAGIRVNRLTGLLPSLGLVLMFGEVPGPTLDDLLVVRGEFDLLPNGAYRVRSH